MGVALVFHLRVLSVVEVVKAKGWNSSLQADGEGLLVYAVE